MPIRINCPNCGKPFSAWDDLVGKTVQCPKCQHKTVLATGNDVLGTPPSPPASAKPGSPPASAKPVPGKPAPGKPVPPRPLQPAGPRPAAPSPAVSPPAVPAPPVRGSAASPPATSKPGPSGTRPIPKPVASPPPVSASELDDDDSLPNGCPNCNATMAPNDDLCDACGYHTVLKKVIDISEMPKRNQATGLERIFKDQLHDAESAPQTLLWLKILGCLLLLGVIWLCLGRWWWIGVLVAAVVGFVWWRKQQAQGRGDGSFGSDPVSIAIWRGTLGVQRTLGWRTWTWPPTKVKSLTLHDPQFDDRELADLDHLADFQAIDLEGTGITDRGLDHLRSLSGLRFLVLRHTQVTAAGVRKLQQDLPRVAIWST